MPEESYTIPFGEANIVRDGKDVTIVTYGAHGQHARWTPAAALAKEGIECEVIDLRTLRRSMGTPSSKASRRPAAWCGRRSQSALLHRLRHLGDGGAEGVRVAQGADPDGDRAAYAGAVLRRPRRPLHPDAAKIENAVLKLIEWDKMAGELDNIGMAIGANIPFEKPVHHKEALALLKSQIDEAGKVEASNLVLIKNISDRSQNVQPY